MLSIEKKNEILEQFVPHGYMNTIFMRTLTAREDLRVYRAMQELEKEGLITKTVVDTENGDQTRVRLTEAGMRYLFSTAGINDPLSLITEPENTAYRIGTNTEQSRREVSLSDVQTFLMSAGAESVYTLLIRAGQNPLILGSPEVADGIEKQRNFSVKTKRALVEFVEQNKDTLLDPSIEANKALFLPRTYNPEVYKCTNTKTKRRSPDNHKGLLLDFVHKDAYVVLKFPRRSLPWRGTAYSALAWRIKFPMKRFGFNIEDQNGYIPYAILLCDSDWELWKKAAYCQKMKSPFLNVLPIVTKDVGLLQLYDMLRLGFDGYMDSKMKEAMEANSDITKATQRTLMAPLQYRGKRMCLGTVLNFKLMSSLMYNVKEGATGYDDADPILAC